MGGGGDTTTVQKSDPPAYLAPYLQGAAKQAYSISNPFRNPYEAYTGQRIAPLNQQQEQGLQMTEQRALSGSPVMNAANQNLQDTLQGKFLTAESNPYLSGAVNKALGDVQTRVNSQFSGNNFGGTAHQEWLGSQLADTALPIYAQNYDAERQRQMQANLFAPQAAQSDYNDLQALLGVGDVRQGQSQQNLDYLYNQWQEQQQDPYNKLSWLSGILNGQGGGVSSTTGPNPYAQNKAASALGGAATGAGLGYMLGGGGAAAGAAAGTAAFPVVGTAIGAGLGLLGGYLM